MRARRSRLAAQVVLIIVGILVALYPLTLGADAAIRCRGAVMRPGDVCRKADGSAGQSYEQRLGDARAARPILVVVGVGVTAFGGALLTAERRRRSLWARPRGQGPDDQGPVRSIGP